MQLPYRLLPHEEQPEEYRHTASVSYTHLDVYKRQDAQIVVAVNIKQNVSINMMLRKMQRKIRS